MSMTMGFRERLVEERLDGFTSVRFNLCFDGYFKAKRNGCSVAPGSFDSKLCRNREKRELRGKSRQLREYLPTERDLCKTTNGTIEAV